MKKIKVLMLGPARDVKGGMTTVVDNYYKYGLDRKVDLKYIETINDKGKISKFISEKKGYVEFKKYIDEYDIVHIHMASRRSTFRKGKYIRIAKKKGKKVILHLHGGEFKMFFNECNLEQQQFIKETLNLSDKIIALSEEWKDYLETLVDNKDKITVIHNAVIIPEDFQKNLATQKFLFLGKIGERKGIYDLLEVFKNVVKNYPNAHLYIGGDGDIDKLNDFINQKNINNNVTYIGWVSGEEKNKYLEECSYFCLPSYNEGMPMSVLEGMAYKNVTISTNVGGIPQVIKDEENGFLIKPGDKEKLFEDIMKAIENEDLRNKLSNNARKTIENKFDINKKIEDLIKIYDALV